MNNSNQADVSFENLPNAVSRVSSDLTELKQLVEEIKASFEPKKPAEYMTRSEVAEMLKCDLSTIHNWNQKGKLRKYCLGNRTYYKRSEIEAAMTVI